MTDPWCCHIWCAMDPIPSIYPIFVTIYGIWHGSVMGYISFFNGRNRDSGTCGCLQRASGKSSPPAALLRGFWKKRLIPKRPIPLAERSRVQWVKWRLIYIYIHSLHTYIYIYSHVYIYIYVNYVYIYIVLYIYIYIICRWWIFVYFPAMVDEPEKNYGEKIAISHQIVCVSTHHASTLSATLGWQALDGKGGLIS